MPKFIFLAKTCICLVVVLLGLLFGLSNASNVGINLLFYQFPSANLGVVLVLFLIAGFVLGILTSMVNSGQKRLSARFATSNKPVKSTR